MDHEKKYNHLIDLLGQLPEETPSPGFTGRVLGSLEPKKAAWWKKVFLMAVTPRTVSFTPVKLVPVAAVCLALIVLFSIHVIPVMNFHDDPSLNVNNGGARMENINLVPILFKLESTPAESVFVIGSFNDWNAEDHKMSVDPADNTWVLTLMLPPGRHEYAFLIDGKKTVPDPNAVFTRKDGFGSYNSVIFANHQHETYL